MKNCYFSLLLLLCTINAQAATYLISPQATATGDVISYKNRTFTVGTDAFADFASWTAISPESNSTVYVAPGTYSETITINTQGLTILGANAFKDWTTARTNESTITGNIFINASDITINGFKFTDKGRIESTVGTFESPISNINILYNTFSESTVTRSTNTPLIELGNVVANEDAVSTKSQCRYKNCQVMHNRFYGDATHYPNFVSFGGAFGNTIVKDNYFTDGGRSIYLCNSQGDIEVSHNKFQDVGKTVATAPDGGTKGAFCVAIYRCGYANSTNVNITSNEFDGCYGEESYYSLFRVFQGPTGSTSTTTVAPKNMTVRVNHNTFKNKTSVSANSNQLGENMLLYADKSTTADVDFNIADNHFDNRFYKFSWMTLQDGRGQCEVYSNTFDQFTYGGTHSTMGNSVITGTDISNHAKDVTLASATILQSMDIDMVTGDMYFLQLLTGTENRALCSDYGLDATTCEGLRLTRVICTKKGTAADPTFTYSGRESMRLAKTGHGVKLAVCRDKNGQLWIITGGRGTDNGTGDDISGTYLSRFKFSNGGVLIMDGSGNTDRNVIYTKHPTDLPNAYAAVDEINRYICVSATKSGRHYKVYDLDQYLETNTFSECKGTILSKKSTTPITGSGIPGDNGVDTWYYQGFDINGDYLYLLEGVSDEGTTAYEGDPTVVINTYNWRTQQFLRRDRVNYARINNTFGEPEGFTIHPDEYGNVCVYLGIAKGVIGSRKANVFKYHIDRHINANGEVIGADTSTDARHFASSQYSGISMTPTLAEFNLTAASTDENPTQSNEITRSTAYLYGTWSATITGEDGEAFKVSLSEHTPFATSITATVTFIPDGLKSDYSATLRLSSPCASDILIPIKATYTGNSTPDTPDDETIPEGLNLVWQNTTVPGLPGGGDYRFAAVSKGNLLVTDKANSKLIKIDKDGQSEYFDPTAALQEYYGSDKTLSTIIANDDAGNLLVGTDFSSATSGSSFMIISADLQQTYKIDLSAITGYTPTRTDQMGRIRGNMLSAEGAYAIFTPSGSTKALIVKIVNGTIDLNNSKFTADLGTTLTTSCIAQPSLAGVAEYDALMSADNNLLNTFYMRNRSNPQNVFGYDGSAFGSKYSFSAETTEGYKTQNASCEGFDWFTLGGNSYYIMPLTTEGTTATRSTAFGIFDQNGNIAAYTKDVVKTGIGQGFGSIVVTPINEYAVNIYHFVAGCVAEHYTFATQQTSGVEDITSRQSIKVFANSGKIHIIGKEIQTTRIYSSFGALVKQSSESIIPMDSMKGIYIVNVTDKEGNTTAHKVIL